MEANIACQATIVGSTNSTNDQSDNIGYENNNSVECFNKNLNSHMFSDIDW